MIDSKALSSVHHLQNSFSNTRVHSLVLTLKYYRKTQVVVYKHRIKMQSADKGKLFDFK